MIKLILFLTSYLFLRTMEKWNNERKANFNSPFLLIYGRDISLLIRLRGSGLATQSDGIKPGIEIERKKIQPSIIFPKA